MLTHTSAKNRDRGFTLIELLTVVIVVGVVAAVSTPIFLRHRDKATVESVHKDAEQAGLALTAQVTGSGTLPASLTPDNPNIWGYKASSPNHRLVEYAVAEDRFRICILNTVANPDAWAVYASATGKVISGTGTEPTGACDGNSSSPALAAEPVRGPSTPIPTPTPTAIPTVTPPPPATPTGVAATAVLGEDQSRVSWNTVSGATAYRVYVDGSATPAWSGTALTATISGLPNGSRAFRVTAVESTRESNLSTAASATIDSNDNIAAAHTVNSTIALGSSWTAPDHSNATATTQSGETTPTSRSLWWRFTPSESGTYTIDTVAPTSGGAAPPTPTVTVWQVASGSTVVPSPNPTIAARGAYNPAGSMTASGAGPIVTMSSGVQYLIRVSTGATTDTGRFGLRVRRGPVNDMLADAASLAQPAVGSTNSVSVSNVLSGAEVNEPADSISSVWYRTTKNVTGDIRINVSGAGFAPVISVWKTSATNPASLGSPFAKVTGTTLTLTNAQVASGENLRIRISGPGTGQGSFTVALTTIASAAPLPSCFTVNWDGAATIYWTKPDSRVNGYDIAIDSPYGREWYYVDATTTSYNRYNLQYEETATVTARTPDGNIPQCGGPVGAGW